MRLFVLLLLPVLVLAGCIRSPEPGFVVTGSIETEDGQPVDGITVLVSGYGAVTTNANGRWTVTVNRETKFTPISDEWIFDPPSVTVSKAGTLKFIAKEGEPAAISFVSGTVTRSLFTWPIDPPFVSRYYLRLVFENTGDWPGTVLVLFSGEGNVGLRRVEVEVPARTSSYEWTGWIELESEDPDDYIYDTITVRLAGDAAVETGPYDLTI